MHGLRYLREQVPGRRESAIIVYTSGVQKKVKPLPETKA